MLSFYYFFFPQLPLQVLAPVQYVPGTALAHVPDISTGIESSGDILPLIFAYLYTPYEYPGTIFTN